MLSSAHHRPGLSPTVAPPLRRTAGRRRHPVPTTPTLSRRMRRTLFLGSPSLPPAVEHRRAGAPCRRRSSHVRTSTRSTRGPDLVGTSATRVLAAAGWLGSAVGYTVAAIALSKSYRHITADNWRAAFDEIRWLMPLMVSSFGMAYLGWVVWATLAAINGHRVAPLASSPFMPPFAYLFGPAAAAVGSIYKPEYERRIGSPAPLRGCASATASCWCRCAVRPAGSAPMPTSSAELLWFPLASLGYRIIAIDGACRRRASTTPTWFAVLVAIDVTLMLATALAVWRAMHSFDTACARDRYSSVENQLPAFMAAAHR